MNLKTFLHRLRYSKAPAGSWPLCAATLLCTLLIVALMLAVLPSAP